MRDEQGSCARAERSPRERPGRCFDAGSGGPARRDEASGRRPQVRAMATRRLPARQVGESTLVGEVGDTRRATVEGGGTGLSSTDAAHAQRGMRTLMCVKMHGAWETMNAAPPQAVAASSTRRSPICARPGVSPRSHGISRWWACPRCGDGCHRPRRRCTSVPAALIHRRRRGQRRQRSICRHRNQMPDSGSTISPGTRSTRKALPDAEPHRPRR